MWCWECWKFFQKSFNLFLLELCCLRSRLQCNQNQWLYVPFRHVKCRNYSFFANYCPMRFGKFYPECSFLIKLLLQKYQNGKFTNEKQIRIQEIQIIQQTHTNASISESKLMKIDISWRANILKTGLKISIFFIFYIPCSNSLKPLTFVEVHEGNLW